LFICAHDIGFSHFSISNEILTRGRIHDLRIPVDQRFASAWTFASPSPAGRIHEIVKERRGVTADTTERLARYFSGVGLLARHASWP
jgi:hypothetical protein